MSWKGGRIVLIYTVALAVGLLIQFDKLEPWLAAKFDNGPTPEWTIVFADVNRVRSGLGLDRAARTLDIAAAGAFSGTYKNSFPSGPGLLADASLHTEAFAAAKARPSADSAPLAEPAGQGSVLSGAQGPAVQPVSSEAPKGLSAPLLRLETPCNVLVVGDSLAIALAIPMEKALKEIEGVTMVSKGKIASGLQNPHVYKWEEALRQFLKEYDPKLVVVMMGANDAKYLTLDPQAPTPTALPDRRLSIYQERLEKFLLALEERGVASYWIGMPIMGDPDLAAKCQALNAVIRQTCEASGHTGYLDTWSLLAGPDGGYAHYLSNEKGTRVRVREGDKIHFSAAGGDIIVKAFLKEAGPLFGQTVKDAKDVAENAHSGEPAKKP